MPSEFAAVDILMRELGAVRLAAHTARPAREAERSAVDKMIRLAGEAVDRVIDAPEDVQVISRARSALDAAEQVIAALAGEVERSQRLRAQAQDLTAQAHALVADSRKHVPS